MAYNARKAIFLQGILLTSPELPTGYCNTASNKLLVNTENDKISDNLKVKDVVCHFYNIRDTKQNCIVESRSAQLIVKRS